MGDENPIYTLRDYSKPSHEGYRNTIELPIGNNVVPLRSDTIRLLQNGCSFHRLWSEDPNQHLKDFLKLVDSIELDGANSLRNGSFSTYSSNYQPKLEKALIDFDSHQEKRLSSLRTQLGQMQDDMISKINLLWKTVSEKLDDTLIRNTSKENEAKKKDAEKSSTTNCKGHETTDEIEDKVESEEEVKEETKEETEEEEEGNPEHFDTFLTMNKLRYYKWLLKNPRPPRVKAKIRTRDVNNVMFSCMIGQFNKEKPYLDLESPVNIMSRLHYNWIISNRLEPRRKPSNPKKNYNFIRRVMGLKVFVENFTYECDFMVLEDMTSVIDHYIGSVVFGKPFVEAIGLVYNREEGTVVFEIDKEKTIFKMPHKMDMFKHIDFADISIDSIPPFVIESDGDNYERTDYSDSLDLGPEYKIFLVKNEEEIFIVPGDGVGIKSDGVASPAM
ncbi:hypothetical protein Tco_1110259 [Tanacetum coccineum]|uniref:MAK10-like protein n=1 Tax=Tanacetum coccineum TaxID=301880 RepID=A0ABQ5IIA1_9ASTR